MGKSDLTQSLKDKTIIVVAGASGDLAKKMTFPSLFQLYVDGYLPPKTQIVGYARSKIEPDEYSEKVTSGIEVDEKSDKAKDLKAKIEEFKKINKYIAGSYDEDEKFQNLEKELQKLADEHFDGESHRIYYLALPPSAFVDISSKLKQHNHKGITNRLVIEKPFGKDTESYKEMMGKIMENWEEDEIYRIDHFLGEEIVQNIPFMRFGNGFIDNMLNKDQVESVLIELKETFGCEGRGGYFDEFGMVRDVLQNHLLQIVIMLTMEKPKSTEPDALRAEKIKLLKAIKPIEKSDIFLGQYTKNGDKPGYTDDETVENKESKTATYSEMVMKIDNDRWRGVPIILKSCKAVDEDTCRVVVQLKADENGLYGKGKGNELIFQKAPEEKIFLKVNSKAPGMEVSEVRTDLSLTYADRYKNMKIPGAYEVVIKNVIQGDHSTFVREDELIAAWEIFTPILKYIEGKEGPDPIKYKYGASGPDGWQDFERQYGFRVEDEGYTEKVTDLKQ